jgi:hypothetical protein
MALFRNDSPGALTMEQAIARATEILEKEARRLEAVKQAKARKQAQEKADAEAAAAHGGPPPQAEDDFTFPPNGILGGFNPYRARMALAQEGRGSDTEIAHVAEGEVVLPAALQTPAVILEAAAAAGVPLGRLRVGHARNSINPTTGAPEFGLGDWFSDVFRTTSSSQPLTRPERLPSDIPLSSGAPMISQDPDFTGIVRKNNAAIQSEIDRIIRASIPQLIQ